MNNLSACCYCPGQRRPKNKAKAKRLRDTPANRAREHALWKALSPRQSRKSSKAAQQPMEIIAYA